MASSFNNIAFSAEFERELIRLKKRFRSLEEDLASFIRASLYAFHKINKDHGGIVRISGLGIDVPALYKVKKFACRALKGKGANSGMRIIYAYDSFHDEIVFEEIYFKGDKKNEDRDRLIRKYRSNNH